MSCSCLSFKVVEGKGTSCGTAKGLLVEKMYSKENGGPGGPCTTGCIVEFEMSVETQNQLGGHQMEVDHVYTIGVLNDRISHCVEIKW